MSRSTSLWERWASVVASALLGFAMVAFVVGYVAYLVAICVADRGLIAPPDWWYFVVGTAAGMGACFAGASGWTDPLWGGVTFAARERGE